jgi:TetR/AcrR family transcriptional regulator
MRSYEGRRLKKPSRKSAGNRVASLSEDSPKSKEAILAAALRVFASDGYDGASMPKIAKLAQVAAPLIHYYFGSKENLWRETVAYSLADIRRDALAIGNATRALAPLDRLRVFLQTVTQHAARWPDNFVMIIAEARSESDRFAWVQENYTGVIFQELLSILQDAKDRKVIKDVALDQLASLLVGGVLVYFTANPEVSDNTDPEDLDRISAEYTDLMFELLVDGIARKKR